MAEEVEAGVSGADRENVFRYPVKGSIPTCVGNLTGRSSFGRLSRSIMAN